MILYVQDYIQVGHRLTTLPGKCQQIHGHSMLVKIALEVDVPPGEDLAVNANGAVLDFSDVKKTFRGHINSVYDHHLLLGKNDPLVELNLPGMTLVDGDPTVENIAKWIFNFMSNDFPISYVEVQETATNGVIYP
jgi:6-pyruvoyltetrahydropterin/6-carboxytetrahydropterin synthase